MPDKRYAAAVSASQGKGINQHLVPVSDLAMSQWLFGGLNADAHDFTLAVLSNSHIPVTSVNQQTPKIISKSTADTLSQWKALLSGHDMAHPPATPLMTPMPGLGAPYALMVLSSALLFVPVIGGVKLVW